MTNILALTFEAGKRLFDGLNLQKIVDTINGLAAGTSNFSQISLSGSTSGTTELKASATASGTLTLPPTTDTIATLAGVGTTVGGVATGSFSKTSNTTLANVTGMAASLVAGATYTFEGYLSTTNGATGGIKLNLNGGTATATSFLCDTWVYNTTTLVGQVNITSIASNMVASAIAATAVRFTGTIVVNAAGTVQLQAAQDASDGTALTIANDSYIKFTRIA